MPLSDTAIRAIRPKDRSYKVSDEKGLYLLVEPTGSKLWRLKYRYLGKEKKLALGHYPDVGLKDARRKRDDARRLLEDGVDPGEQKKTAQRARLFASANTFEAVAQKYLDKRAVEGLSEVTLKKSQWFLGLLAQGLGSRPINEISAADLLDAIRPYEVQKKYETARRMKAFASRVFIYAIGCRLVNHNVAADLQGALIAPKVKNFAAITDEAALTKLLRACDTYSGQPATCFAVRLAPYLFRRPGEIRQMQWQEVDLDKAVWVIPAAKTKMRREARIPLARQVVAILRDAVAMANGSAYVFPAMTTTKKPLSENTLNQAIRRMGFGKNEMTSHGFRAVASTIMNERHMARPDVIERALDHKERDGVRASYNHAEYWTERVALMQAWADLVDEIKSGKPMPESH